MLVRRNGMGVVTAAELGRSGSGFSVATSVKALSTSLVAPTGKLADTLIRAASNPAAPPLDVVVTPHATTVVAPAAVASPSGPVLAATTVATVPTADVVAATDGLTPAQRAALEFTQTGGSNPAGAQTFPGMPSPVAIGPTAPVGENAINQGNAERQRQLEAALAADPDLKADLDAAVAALRVRFPGASDGDLIDAAAESDPALYERIKAGMANPGVGYPWWKRHWKALAVGGVLVLGGVAIARR